MGRNGTLAPPPCGAALAIEPLSITLQAARCCSEDRIRCRSEPPLCAAAESAGGAVASAAQSGQSGAAVNPKRSHATHAHPTTRLHPSPAHPIRCCPAGRCTPIRLWHLIRGPAQVTRTGRMWADQRPVRSPWAKPATPQAAKVERRAVGTRPGNAYRLLWRFGPPVLAHLVVVANETQTFIKRVHGLERPIQEAPNAAKLSRQSTMPLSFL